MFKMLNSIQTGCFLAVKTKRAKANSKLWEYHLGYILGYFPDLTGKYSELRDGFTPIITRAKKYFKKR